MKKEELCEVLGEIDDAYIRDAHREAACGDSRDGFESVPYVSKGRNWVRWAAPAACLLLVLTGFFFWKFRPAGIDPSGTTSPSQPPKNPTVSITVPTSIRFTSEDSGKTTLTYSDTGRLTRIYATNTTEYNDAHLDYDSDGQITSLYSNEYSYTFTWNSEGSLAMYVYQELTDDGSGVSAYRTTVTYTYDSAGNLILESTEKTDIYSEGAERRECRYTYEDGRLVMWTTYIQPRGSETMTLLSSEYYVYDEAGNRISYERFNSGLEVPECTKQYTYSENGRLSATEVKYRNADGEIATETYTYDYDTAGNLIAESRCINGVLDSRKDYTYQVLNVSPKDAQILQAFLEWYGLAPADTVVSQSGLPETPAIPQLPEYVPGSIELEDQAMDDYPFERKYRIAYYRLWSEFEEPLSEEEKKDAAVWFEDLCANTNNGETAEEMILVSFIKRYNITRAEFDFAVEQFIANNAGIDFTAEEWEIPNGDILYTFDNEIINHYYRYE